MERETGIEPATSPWQGDALPLSHSRLYVTFVRLRYISGAIVNDLMVRQIRGGQPQRYLRQSLPNECPCLVQSIPMLASFISKCCRRGNQLRGAVTSCRIGKTHVETLRIKVNVCRTSIHLCQFPIFTWNAVAAFTCLADNWGVGCMIQVSRQMEPAAF